MSHLERIYMISMGSIVTGGALLQSHLLSTTTMKRLLLGICCMTKDLQTTQRRNSTLIIWTAADWTYTVQCGCVVINYFEMCWSNTWHSPHSQCCPLFLWWCVQRQRQDILCHMLPSWFYPEISELNVKQSKMLTEPQNHREGGNALDHRRTA